jgi:putative ABC transport system substrate-binding protein
MYCGIVSRIMICAARMTLSISRRCFIAQIGAAASAIPVAAYGNQTAASRIPRIGLLVGNEPESAAAFMEGMSSLGYIPGENIIVETRVVGRGQAGTNPPAEMAKMGLALIVVGALPGALTVREINPAMPMVIAVGPGLVSNGFAKTLERPGGNVTGLDELPPGLTAKRLQLLKAAAPNVSRVGLLSTTPGIGGHETQLADAEQAAKSLGITVKPYRAATVQEISSALTAMADEGMNGLLNFQGGLSFLNRQTIVDFAAKRQIPAIYQATAFAEAGGLMAWAPNLQDQFRVAARYVDQILRGASPGDLPITHPPRYYLTIHAGAAKQLGLNLPPPVLVQTDRLIA